MEKPSPTCSPLGLEWWLFGVTFPEELHPIYLKLNSGSPCSDSQGQSSRPIRPSGSTSPIRSEVRLTAQIQAHLLATSPRTCNSGSFLPNGINRTTFHLFSPHPLPEPKDSFHSLFIAHWGKRLIRVLPPTLQFPIFLVLRKCSQLFLINCNPSSWVGSCPSSHGKDRQQDSWSY